jgi:hypothetical protein
MSVDGCKVAIRMWVVLGGGGVGALCGMLHEKESQNCAHILNKIVCYHCSVRVP